MALWMCRPSLRVPTVFFLTPSRLFTQNHALLQSRRWGGKRPPFTPSPEQQEVARLCMTQNVVVSARPGSGKTATAEAIVNTHPDLRILVLTYSKRLQAETRRRLAHYTNCQVFTFHAMAARLFKRFISRDSDLLDERHHTLSSKRLPAWMFESFDIIILDEFQDCTDLLFWLVNCFIRANEIRRNIDQPARVVVLGDERQSIYQFRGADQRYLTLAHEILSPLSRYSFASVPMHNSFRLPEPCTRFINNTFLGGEPYISSIKPGPKPIVLRCNPFQAHRLVKALLPLIKLHGYWNTAIIVPSIRRNKPLSGIVNMLSKTYHIPICVPTDDEAPLHEKVVSGKLCVSTIHQFKGSERALVIVFGMDDSYFEFFARNVPDDCCPNEVFVALTRSTDQLVLVHNDTAKLMPCMSVDALCETATVVNITGNEAPIDSPNTPVRTSKQTLDIPSNVNVREMTRFLQDVVVRDIIQRELCIRQISPPLSKCIELDGIVLSEPKKNLYEAVSDINGLVVAAAFEHSRAGTLKTLDVKSKDILDSVPPVRSRNYIPWLCRQACEYEARASGYIPRSNQMKNHLFNWIARRDLTLARSRLEEEVKTQEFQHINFEVDCGRTLQVDGKDVALSGRADIIATSHGKTIDTIWEIKHVSQLSLEHFLQAALYTYLFATPGNGELPRTILYNVLDGNKWEISPYHGYLGLQRMVESILKLRYTTKNGLGHEEFREMCAKTTEEVLG